MRRLIIYLVLFAVFAVVLSSGCTSTSSDDKVISEIRESAGTLGGLMTDVGTQTTDVEAQNGDIGAETEIAELEDSLYNAFAFADSEIPKFEEMDVKDPLVSEIRDSYVNTLKYTKEYTYFKISYLETGDLSDKETFESALSMWSHYVFQTSDLLDEYEATVASSASSSQSSSSGVQIIVSYDGKWSGSYGDISGQSSYDGAGEETIPVPDAKNIVSCAFQKRDSGNGELVVQIIKNGKVLEEGSTSAQYGVVTCAANV